MAQDSAGTPERGKPSIAEREEAVLRLWKEREIFQKSLAATDGAEPYVFYDGPPFATGLPHYGHLLAGTLKDVMPRYQTMRGRYVRRQWGWDCHGLPIENLIEKELGFKQKREIEEYGVEKFNQKAADSVLMYDKEWKEVVPRMGRFVDMELSYKTMDPTYTESIWWAFKTLYEKKIESERLIYEGYKSMHICPRCETTLAISEVGMNYKDTKDISVYVKFALADEPDTFLLAWTTTPWTLPGNVALAVGAEITYAKIEHEGKRYIVAKDRFLDVMKKGFGEKFSFDGGELAILKGKDLIGRAYTPLFDAYASDEKL
ncbi:MAG TPA: class I tRNA ligase family protein, partial [Candidatus Paceibacterota bacterium]|nr:class I tRNA ligase family protein [Candidatus Paceibacterota bacterium]